MKRFLLCLLFGVVVVGTVLVGTVLAQDPLFKRQLLRELDKLGITSGGVYTEPSGGATCLSYQSQASGSSLSFVVPGGTLAATGDALHIYGSGTMGSNVGDDMRVSFGGTVLHLTTGGDASIEWVFNAYIVRTSATEVIYAGGWMPNNPDLLEIKHVTAGSITLADDQTLTLDYDATAGTPLTLTMRVTYEPGP